MLVFGRAIFSIIILSSGGLVILFLQWPHELHCVEVGAALEEAADVALCVFDAGADKLVRVVSDHGQREKRLLVPLGNAHLEHVALLQILQRLESDLKEGIRLAYYGASRLETRRLDLVVLCRSGDDTSGLGVKQLVLTVERLEIEAIGGCG